MSQAALRAKLTSLLRPKSSVPSDPAVLGTNDFGVRNNKMNRQDKSYGSVLMYAQPIDVAILVVSSFLALLAGGLNPIMTVRKRWKHLLSLFQTANITEIDYLQSLCGQLPTIRPQ